MSNYIKHAMTEFRAAGFIDENDKYSDEMQEAICKHVMKLLEVFDEEGHSGSSAPYAIDMFSKLAGFKPLVPLTGEDWEWNDVSSFGDETKIPHYQNTRASNVFKDPDGRAYDIDGTIFWEWWTDPETGEKSKSYYTNRESWVYIEFPYMPTREYVYRESGAEG